MVLETVEPDCKVTIKYIMRTLFKDGTMKERPQEEMSFIFGTERQVPSLEKALAGSSLGERLGVNIPPDEIYGGHNPDLVKEIPKKGLIRQRLKPGHYYRQMKKGCLVSFKVLKVNPDTVLADFNEPMAGISVKMEVQVTGIRKASEEEIRRAAESQLKKSIGCG